MILFSEFLRTSGGWAFNNHSKKLFISLTGIFFAFIIRGLFHNETVGSFISISPMLPLPIIGLMILLQVENGLRINSEKLALFSQISVSTALIIYIILSQILGPESEFSKHYLGRLELFSGNPIPFSLAIFGVSVFCLSAWNSSTTGKKILAISCFLLGTYFAGFLSGARGTLISIIISGPFLIWFISKSILKTFLITAILITFGAIILFLHKNGVIEVHQLDRVLNGINAILNDSSKDYSVQYRIYMWIASIEAIKGLPLFGYDISNRFFAIKPYLPETFSKTFTHPHNDIFASLLGAGFLGGALGFLSLLSPLWAAFLSESDKDFKLFLAFIVVLSIIFTANFNTVFFNDVTSAWLAFSTFLIWNVKIVSANE